MLFKRANTHRLFFFFFFFFCETVGQLFYCNFKNFQVLKIAKFEFIKVTLTMTYEQNTPSCDPSTYFIVSLRKSNLLETSIILFCYCWLLVLSVLCFLSLCCSALSVGYLVLFWLFLLVFGAQWFLSLVVNFFVFVFFLFPAIFSCLLAL